ncbi:MAG: DUF2461 domain-containing protein [Saprospiraceae bacterium]|nr:DUF2461 domain-containing protein [Saprospiraceae bacterium]
MPVLSQAYLDFFEELALNNNREWFTANKKRYEKDVKEPFIKLVEAIVGSLHDSEPDLSLIPAKQMLFRINRDIRFSKDKRPYKEHLSASITRFGTKDKIYPGHYFQVGAHESFLAGGAYWFEEKEMLLRVRRYILDNHDRFLSLINDPVFVKHWDSIKGEKNKRLSPEFTDFVDSQPLIANTQYYWVANIDPKMALQDNFVDILRGHFEAAQPLNQFLIEAMYW